VPSDTTADGARGGWPVRYPDLTGKTAVIGAGASVSLGQIVRGFLRNGVQLAVVCADRAAVDAATSLADASAIAGYGITGDPDDPALWERVIPHVEQRLGPIDIVVCAATRTDALPGVVAADMLARRRGVLCATDGSTVHATVPRYREVRGGTGEDVAAALLWACSDTVAAATAVIDLGP
jgi:hypothetical protein